MRTRKRLGWTAIAIALVFCSLGFGSQRAAAQVSSVVVTMPFGAALRYSPSSDADVYYTAACGDTFRVVDSSNGWYEVNAGGTFVWVGGARVANAASPGRYSCAGGRTFQIGDGVITRVQSGCLSLRYTPSRSAGYDSCVENGHYYVIQNGPLEVNGEDWFDVWSPSTGSGWSLAEFLYPAP
jgi:Bacterial SH3 domain